MRKLLVTCLIALLAAAASAQRTPAAPNTGSTRTTLTPASSGTRQSSQPGVQRGNQNSTTTPARTKPSPAAVPRTDDAANNASGASQSATQSRTSQPQNSSAGSRNTTARPSLNQQNISPTTSRSIANAPKKAPDVKVVNPVRVKWMTLEEALEKSKTDKRKIFVDVYTDWCGWCKRMDSTTFINPAVAQYLNEHYYPVKFNAEQQKEVVFKDKTYQFKKNGARGYHELAAEWLNNRLSYPTAVFLDENQGTIQPLPGYQDAAKMEAVLNYFGTDSHKKTPWETYQKNFTGGQK